MDKQDGQTGWTNRDADRTFIANAREDIPALLAAYDRLRAREAAFVEIAEAVAEGVSDSETGDCCFCGCSGYPHEPNCPTTKARALLGKSE